MRFKPGIIILAIVFGILLGEIYYLKMLPCSFVRIYYTSETKEFNKAPTEEMTVEINGYDFNYRIPHQIKDDRFKEIKDLAQNDSLSTIDTLIMIANWVRSKLLFGKPDYNSDEILVDDIINESKNNDLKVLCDSYARLFVITAQALGIPARIVELRGHVVPEAFVREIGKWIMIDPTNGYYISKDGEPLSVAEMIICYREGASLTPTVFVKSRGDDCLYSTENEVNLKNIYLNGFTNVSDQNVNKKKIMDTIAEKLQLPIVIIQFIDENSTLIGYNEKILRYAVVSTFVVFVLLSIVIFRKKD